jgi:transposase
MDVMFFCKMMVFIYYRNTFSLPILTHIVRDTFLRILIDVEKNLLHLMLEDKESEYIAKIILLQDDGYTVPEIRMMTNHHDHNIRKWIHRFDKKGIDGIISKKHNHKQHKFYNNMEKKIVDIASANPREDYGFGFSKWSLCVRQSFLCMT